MPNPVELTNPKLRKALELVLIPAWEQWHNSASMAINALTVHGEAFPIQQLIRQACAEAGIPNADTARLAELGHVYVPVQIRGEQVDVTVPQMNAVDITSQTVLAYVQRPHLLLATKFQVDANGVPVLDASGNPIPINGKPIEVLSLITRGLGR